jgi:hypothetical protein
MSFLSRRWQPSLCSETRAAQRGDGEQKQQIPGERGSAVFPILGRQTAERAKASKSGSGSLRGFCGFRRVNQYERGRRRTPNHEIGERWSKNSENRARACKEFAFWNHPLPHRPAPAIVSLQGLRVFLEN